jgi:hypothetical protein
VLNLLAAISAVLGAGIYPVSEWLAPADHSSLEIRETGWSGFTFRNVYTGPGETMENWSRRITTWSGPSDTFGPGPVATQAATIREAVLADCPGARSGALRLFTWSGRPAAEFWIACDLLPATGRRDHYMVRMIAGEAHQLSAAVTFRAPPTEAEVRAASAYLDTLILCTERTAGAACRSVPAPPQTAGPGDRRRPPAGTGGRCEAEPCSKP